MYLISSNFLAEYFNDHPLCRFDLKLKDFDNDFKKYATIFLFSFIKYNKKGFNFNRIKFSNHKTKKR